jgi:hypothetical protein
MSTEQKLKIMKELVIVSPEPSEEIKTDIKKTARTKRKRP